MDYRRLGATGLKVSPLCLGTMNFGWVSDEKESFAIMDRALDLGINFIDTADVYGAWATEAGDCEALIGRWLAQGGRRDAIFLATKVYNPVVRKERRKEINRDTRCYSRVKIIRHCEDSLRRLGTDRIDLYQLHHIDRECPMDELWEAMDVLQTQGKIAYAGSSNFAGWDIAHACMAARMMGKAGLASEQSVYNLDNRMVELEVVPACRHFGLGLIPWSPLAGGLLGGALDKAKNGRRSGKDRAKQLEAKKPQLKKYEALCKKLGEKPADVALAWLLANPVVTAPIIGPRTVAQMEGSLRATEIKLSSETLKKLDVIFPGPGGEAPNAYAW
ncbi:MAG: aldo/keto reductase [Puniceicoccaceae bacterium]|nr:MAG: aldo/keto reductase [Puniceicoccaceae bacterium]